MVLIEPAEAMLGQRPATVAQLPDAPVIPQRLQVQRRTHIAMTAPDRPIDVLYLDACVGVRPRTAPERIENVRKVSLTHD